MNPLTVLDIFCGAGGFSEGFRQQGFEIILGVDRWQPAINTFNHNFGLKSKARDVLEFLDSVAAIEALPDTDVILGSPPCVSFSSSNISGKADKSHGITLTQTFLRIVAVKKWKKDSKLKAWFMENVPRSSKHLAEEYSFSDLGLEEWAKDNKIGPSKIAVRLADNNEVINSADYGSPQTRKRVITGEIVARKLLVRPPVTHSQTPQFGKKLWRTIEETIRKLPDPSSFVDDAAITDPNFPSLKIPGRLLTDHFYDTGLYECEWRFSRHWKINHPYMGKMSFPEDDTRPSRTVTATKIGSSREALIYRSGYSRTGDGEFRTATVREAACLMGFPITYQFKGSEGTKWRLVGNAVCPSVSRALARQVLHEIGHDILEDLVLQQNANIDGVGDLNTFSAKLFNNQPRKNSNSRFRWHPFKDGNMTVTLSNYDIEKKNGDVSRWLTSIQYGSGEGFPTFLIPDDTHEKLESILKKLKGGEQFLNFVRNDLLNKTAKAAELQRLYEAQQSSETYLEPTRLVDYVATAINKLSLENQIFKPNGEGVFTGKKVVPMKQLFALYAINKISATANGL